MVFEQMRKRMKIFVYIIVVALVVGGLYFGFGYYFGGGRNNNTSTQTLTDQGVLARVNGEPIYYQEFYNVLQNYQNSMLGLSEWEIIPFQAQILQSLLNRSMLLQEAKERGLKVDITAEEVDATLQSILQQNQMTLEQLEKNLEGRNITVDDIKADIKASMEEGRLIQTLVDNVRNEVKVTEEDIKREYEQVHLYDIFVQYANHSSKEEARAKIEEAQRKLQDGAEFTAVAKEYSESPAAEQGGDLGFVSRKDYLNEELLKTAFEMKVGDTSGVIETDQGLHLIYVSDKVAAEGEAYEEQKARIEEELRKKRGETHYYQWFDQLKENAKIEIFNPVFSGFFNLQNENYAQAVEDFKTSVEENPRVAVLRTFLAQAYYQNGQEKEAISTYEQAVKDFPEDYQLWFAFGELYRNMGETEKAVPKYEKAGELARDDYYVNLQLMRVFQYLDMDDKAKIYEQRMDEIRKEYEEQQKQQEQQSQEQQNQEQENTGENKDTAANAESQGE